MDPHGHVPNGMSEHDLWQVRRLHDHPWEKVNLRELLGYPAPQEARHGWSTPNLSLWDPLYGVLKFRWRLSVAGTAALSVLTISFELQVAPFALCSRFFIFT